MLSHHIALWDAIASCGITGSSDSTVSNVVANDLRPLLAQSDINAAWTLERLSDAWRQILFLQTGEGAR